MDTRRMLKLRDDLGAAGLVALGLLAAGLLFLFMTLKPLEERSARLDSLLAAAPKSGPAADPSARLSDFYAFFDRQEDAADWLASLNALARSAGVEMASGRYQMHDAGAQLARYELTLPLTGGYAQIRRFLDAALGQIPVLSVDQVSFRRKSAGEAQIQADVRLSLYLARSPGASGPAAAPLSKPDQTVMR